MDGRIGLTCAAVLLAAGGLASADNPTFRVQPSEVLVVFNDTFKDADGNGKSDSRDVAEYYATRRGIPKENLLPLDLQGRKGRPIGRDYPDFYERILTPVHRKLETRAADGKPLKDRIVYIVVCYGVPVALDVHLEGKEGEHPFRPGRRAGGAGRRSVDQWLIDIEANFHGGYDKATRKPTRSRSRAAPPVGSTQPTTRPAVPTLGGRRADIRHAELFGLYMDPRRAKHFKELKRTYPKRFPYYLVTRLGLSPGIAARQVDGALYAERYLRLAAGDPRDGDWHPRIVLDHQDRFAADHVASLASLAAILNGHGPRPLFAPSRQGLLKPWPMTVDNRGPEIGQPGKDKVPHPPTLTATIDADGVDTAGRRVRLTPKGRGRRKTRTALYWSPGLEITSASGGKATVLALDLPRNALRLSSVEGFKPGNTITWQSPGAFPITDCFFYYGYYGLGQRWDCYRFLPGAIGIHVDSSCMTWARHQLSRGLSVAFGVVTEPYSAGIPYMNCGWVGIATGHDVCESLYAGLYANTRWAGVLFADPLYAPFRSLGLRDTTRPVIRRVKAERGRAGELVVTAELDDRTPDQRADIALFKIDYGPTAKCGRTVPYFDWPEPGKTGRVTGRRYGYTRRFRHTIAGLQANTTYRLRVTARDPYGNVATSRTMTVRTSAARPRRRGT